MNCQQIKDELLTLVGSETMPQEIQEHLNTCAGCRTFWAELTALTGSLGSDENFYLGETELQSAVDGVDARIDQLEMRKVTDVRSAWYSYVPAAAAVILLVGISISAYLMGWFTRGDGQAELTSPDTAWVVLENGDLDVIDNGSFDYVMYQSTAYDYTASAELLYDELTEEELEYLDENFDVGEIL